MVNVGDIVIVITQASNFTGMVKYMPMKTEPWVFVDDKGNERYVYNPIEIIKGSLPNDMGENVIKLSDFRNNV